MLVPENLIFFHILVGILASPFGIALDGIAETASGLAESATGRVCAFSTALIAGIAILLFLFGVWAATTYCLVLSGARLVVHLLIKAHAERINLENQYYAARGSLASSLSRQKRSQKPC